MKIKIMKCPYDEKECTVVDTSGMDKPPCTECLIYLQYMEDDDEVTHERFFGENIRRGINLFKRKPHEKM